MTRCDALKQTPFSASDDRLYRGYLTPAHRASLDQLTAWMAEAGMTVRLDEAGNLIGRYDSGVSEAKSLIIGSHIDSVKDAGAYDGPLGIMLGIDVVQTLHDRQIRLPFAIEIYAFGDEEGSRFPSAMLCSRAVTGRLEAQALNVVDADGVLLQGALDSFGLDRVAFLNAKRDPADLLGYFEAHIEQGPVLEAEGLALGLVTAIACQLRYQVQVKGVAGHAGTNSMDLRVDALTAAAEMVLAIEHIGRAGPDDLVATVGRMSVEPGAPNVVPGLVTFSLDIRAGKEIVRDAAASAIMSEITQIARLRKVTASAEMIHDLPASPCDADLQSVLAASLITSGHVVRPIVSGAGHDAMAFSGLTPTAMLFIRCREGISHNPLEAVTAEDCEAAFDVMLNFVLRLGNMIND